jgi:two-component system phosphate regulon response regulator PhoB
MTNETGAAAEPHCTANSAPAFSEPEYSRRVLIIERDPQSVQALRGKLAQAGFEVTVVAGEAGDEAFAALEEQPHLVMLDWDLPAVITMQLVHRARRRSPDDAPRLMAFSSFAGEQHVVSGFEQGVDDYVVKPYSVPEVVARARAVLRPQRRAAAPHERVEFGPLTLEPGASRLAARGREVSLRSLELRLLGFLMRHPERAFTREALLKRVWGLESRASLRAVNVTVQRIRQTLAPHGCRQYLQSVRGVGYVLSARAPR